MSKILFFIVSALAACCVIPDAHASVIVRTPQSLSLSRGLVGWWNFDGNTVSGTQVADASGNGNRGTLTNGPTLVKGKIGQGISFDGVSNYVDAGNPSSLQLTGAMTISSWLYIRSVGVKPTAVNSFFFTKFGGGTPGWFLATGAADKKIIFHVITPDGTQEVRVDSSGQFPSNTWVHYVGVYEPSTAIRLYVNGIIDSSTTASIPASQFNSNENVVIGGRPV